MFLLDLLYMPRKRLRWPVKRAGLAALYPPQPAGQLGQEIGPHAKHGLKT